MCHAHWVSLWVLGLDAFDVCSADVADWTQVYDASHCKSKSPCGVRFCRVPVQHVPSLSICTVLSPSRVYLTHIIISLFDCTSLTVYLTKSCDSCLTVHLSLCT